MAISDMIEKMREKKKERKELIRNLDEQSRIEEMLSERKKSANQRELERFMKEQQEEQIKFELDKARKIREKDIKFNHNPLFVPNITNHAQWNVLKEKNLFSNGKMTLNKGDGNVIKNNPNLLKNNTKLFK